MKKNDIAISTTVRADESIITQFLEYHLAIGIDHIYIFLDDPLYNLPVSQYSDHQKVTFIQCDEQYWSFENTIRFDDTRNNEKPLGIEQRQFSNYAYARELTECDWIANIDIDEFIYSPYQLKTFLKILPANVFSIRMLTKEAVYTQVIDKNDIFNTCFFKINSKKNDKSALQFYPKVLNANGGFWGHKLGKILARSKEPVRFIANHYVAPLNDELLVAVEIDCLTLLHFEGMSETYFVEKQIRRITNDVVVQRLAKNEFTRLNYFKEQYEQAGVNGLAKLYNVMHVFKKDRFAQALNLGFIREIDYRAEPIPYNLTLEDFHSHQLKFSVSKEKVISNGDGYPILILPLKVDESNKCILFFSNEQGNFFSLASDGVSLCANSSSLAKMFELENSISDGFVCVKNKDKFLISFNNGTVRLNSENLGDWELFELKEVG